jgi:hypothetical protein
LDGREKGDTSQSKLRGMGSHLRMGVRRGIHHRPNYEGWAVILGWEGEGGYTTEHDRRDGRSS